MININMKLTKNCLYLLDNIRKFDSNEFYLTNFTVFILVVKKIRVWNEFSVLPSFPHFGNWMKEVSRKVLIGAKFNELHNWTTQIVE